MSAPYQRDSRSHVDAARNAIRRRLRLDPGVVLQRRGASPARARRSLAAPASACPSCDTPIKPYDNIPILSWLILRGRCRSCSEPISARYPLVEGLTAALYAAVVAVHHSDVALLVMGLVLVAFLVPIALIDLDTKLIPNRLTGPAAVLAIVLGIALDPSGQVERLIAGVAAAAALGVPSLINRGGMGLGDAKLVGVLGLFLGSAVIPAFFVAFVVGTVVGIWIVARKGMAAGRRPSRSGRFWRSAASSDCWPEASSSRCTSRRSEYGIRAGARHPRSRHLTRRSFDTNHLGDWC